MGEIWTNLFLVAYLTHFFTGEVINIKIDHEYSCVWSDEFDYLTEHGVRYTFVKTVDGVTVWKFRKCAELFRVLSDFYSEVYYR